MDLFSRIEDGQAIIRMPGGVFKQVDLYHRGGRVYLAAKGGFVRVENKFGATWPTSNPGVTVIDHSQSIPGLFFYDGKKAPAYNG